MASHKFKSRVERLDTGLRMHVIPVPATVADKLTDSKRVIINIGATELKRAIQGQKSGQPYIQIGRTVLKELGLRLGSTTSVTLRPDPKPETVDVEPELLEALKLDEAANKRWNTFTLGMQRSLNHYVATAKREDTRIRRALELAEKIRTHTLYGDTNERW